MRGELRWAVVPYAPAAPLAGPGWEGGISLRDYMARIREGGGADALLLPVKVRPVLLLHSWVTATHDAYLVLRTRRMATLDETTLELVREDADPGLVPLSGVSAGAERVAMVGAISRVHASALDDQPLGWATPAEMRLIGERVAARLELDLDHVVERRALALLDGLGPA